MRFGKSKAIVAVFVAVAVVAGATWLVASVLGPGERESSRISEAPATAGDLAPRLAGTLPSRTSSTAGESLPIAEALSPVLRADHLAAAFDDLRARRGDEDFATRAAWASIREACRTLAAYSAEAVVDPLRDWAAQDLASRCGDLDVAALDERYKRATQGGGGLDSVSLGKLVAEGNIEEAVTSARENLRSGDLASSSALDSMLFLVEADAPPPSLALHPDNPDSYRALGRAALALTCERQTACGPDSLTTLSFCVQFGCQPGSTLLQAMQQSLPPRDYEAVLSTLYWVRSM